MQELTVNFACVSESLNLSSPAFMALIKPFAALRPKPELASRICELPYDVMSSEEAGQMAAGNPLSFLHVSKPEIDLPADTDVYSPTVYAKAKKTFGGSFRKARYGRKPSRVSICIAKSWARTVRWVW